MKPLNSIFKQQPDDVEEDVKSSCFGALLRLLGFSTAVVFLMVVIFS